MIETTGNDLVVIASDPNELAEGQAATIEAVKRKEAEAQVEAESATALVLACEGAGINADTAKRQEKRAESRVRYLSKVRAALEAGFVIVPNFPGRTIAVRVKRDKPIHQLRKSDYGTPSMPDVAPQALPVGEGRYVDPQPFIGTDELKLKKENGQEITRREAWPIGFDEEIALPVEFLKPTVVQRTGKCMTRRIFDEIAITGDSAWQQGDPMVLGRIRDPKSKRQLTFLVAWFVDTRDI